MYLNKYVNCRTLRIRFWGTIASIRRTYSKYVNKKFSHVRQLTTGLIIKQEVNSSHLHKVVTLEAGPIGQPTLTGCFQPRQ